MKNVLITLTAIIISLTAMAQAPAGFTYQAAVRDADGNVITEQEIAMEIKILQGSANGTTIYTETHTAETSAHGIVNLTIGAGSTSDDFTTIDWSAGPYFIATAIDVAGGTNFTDLGTSQLLSVPYAMHAQSAGTVNETDPVFTDWDKSTGITVTESQISDMGTYVETEADPVFGAWDKTTGIEITESQISDFGTYLTEEVDGSVTNEIEMPTDAQAGDMSYYDGTNWQKVTAPEEDGLILTYCGGEPIWTVDGICSVEIGDYAYGGIVFYIFQEGDPGYVEGEQHGLVCALPHQNGKQWGCDGVEVDGADGTAIGTGAQNTIDIETACTTESTSADFCANLVLEGYDDWFLPSKDELVAMLQQKEIVDSALVANDDWGFLDAWYSSSSEADATRHWIIHFGDDLVDMGPKITSTLFRPVRKF